MNTSSDITAAITDRAAKFGPRNPQQFRQLHGKLLKLPASEAYFGLMDVFKAPRYDAQELAGMLLVSLKPQIPEPVDGVLRRVINTWDVSVEELPWYLAEMCGVAEMHGVLDALEAEAKDRQDSATQKIIDTMRYWLRGIVNGNVWPGHEFLLLEVPANAEQARAMIERNSLQLRQRFEV